MVAAASCAACLGSHEMKAGHTVAEESHYEVNRIRYVMEPLRRDIHHWEVINTEKTEQREIIETITNYRESKMCLKGD